MDIYQGHRIDQIFHRQYRQHHLRLALPLSPQSSLPGDALHFGSGEVGKIGADDENERYEDTQLLAGVLHLQLHAMHRH